MIPLSWRIAAAGVALALLAAGAWALHHHIYQQGYEAAKAECMAAAQRDHDQKEAELAGVGVAYAEKAAKARVITQTIIKEVDKYVPNSLPMLPGDFRLLHDAAANGQAIDDTSRADALPVAPKDVAATVAENYADCRYDKGRLETLQEVVRVLNGESHGATQKD